MPKVAVGSIPEKICYVFSKERDAVVGSYWDIDHFGAEDSKTVKQTVLPAFPTDALDQAMVGTATTWAKNHPYNEDEPLVQMETVENLPIKDVKVLSLEHRGQGGRAYKVIVGKYYVDLREDVLMDTMLKVGIKEGGVLGGEFIWCKMHSQMRLVRVGSELHKMIAEFDSKRNMKPIGKKELQVGTIYQDKKKNKVLFCGYVNTFILMPAKRGMWSTRENTVAPFDFKKNSIRKGMLFYSIPTYEKQSEHIKNMKLDKNKNYFKIQKTHTYIEKAGEAEVPENIVLHLKEQALKSIKQNIVEYVKQVSPRSGFKPLNSWDLQDRIGYNSEFMHITKYEEPVSEIFDVKKFLLFS
jgi:hypothetical protein